MIALGIGGALETVKDGETGVFFPEPTVDSLCAAMEEFESMRFDQETLVRHARGFGREVFLRNMRRVLGLS